MSRKITRSSGLPILSLVCAGLLACAGSSRGADVIEREVAWKIGEMTANLSLNRVYVINETDGDLLGFTTAGINQFSEPGGRIRNHKRFDYSLKDATMFVPEDGSALFVSVPSIRKLYRLDPDTLAEVSVTDLNSTIGSFVVAADGFLYTSNETPGAADNMLKINPTSGVEVAWSTSTPTIKPLVRLGSDGVRFYLLNRTSSISAGVFEYSTTAALPIFQNNLWTAQFNDRDLSIDDADNRAYRAAEGIWGITVWTMDTQTQSFMDFAGPRFGAAVAQLPSSDSVWGASGGTTDGVLAEFNKQTAVKTRQIIVGSSNSRMRDGAVLPGRLEITSNEKLLYGVSEWMGNVSNDVDGYRYYFGMTDVQWFNAIYNPATTPPFAPSDVTASDNAELNRVDITWDKSARATLYRIYRNTTDDSAGAVEIGTTNAGTTFSDTNAVVHQTYYYWVRAESAAGLSPFGLSDPGSALTPPGAPSSFTATDGTHTDSVEITCTFDSSATGFRIYRNTTNNFVSATEIGSSTSTTYTDSTVPQGELHYYWGRAENAAGLSPVSAVDSGHAGDLAPPQTAPTNLTASDGTDSLKISLSWSTVPDARSYEILRNTGNDSATAEIVGSSVGNSFDDTAAFELVTYYYWVRAVNTAGNGPLSSVETGQRAELLPPDAPSTVIANDGTYSYRIGVGWSASPYANTYTLLRNTIDDSASATQIVTTSATEFFDYSAIPGPTYFYWVRANNAAGTGAISNSDSGFASIPPPPANPPIAVGATTGTLDDRVRITWTTVSQAKSYSIYRSTTNDSATATLIGTNTLPSSRIFTDFGTDPLVTYYYWVKAFNISGETGFSPSASGYEAIGRPRNVYATNDLFDSMVRVTWNPVAEATSYHVYRHTNSQSSSATQIATVTAPALRYEDASASPGQTYYYWVKAEISGGQSGEFDLDDTGRRATESAQGTGFIAADRPLGVEFDLLRDRAYITTARGVVEAYDLDQQQIINGEWNTGGGLMGADLGPNDQRLLLAQTRETPATMTGRVDSIDLTSGSLQSYVFPLDDREAGSYDVAILAGDQAIVTTRAESFVSTPLRKLDLNTGTFSVLNTTGVGSGSGKIGQDSLLSRTPDRSLVAILEGDDFSGPFFSYRAATEDFGFTSASGSEQRMGSISPDGSQLAMRTSFDIEIRALNGGRVIHTFPFLEAGVAFHPTRPFFIAADSRTDCARVFSTADWSEVDAIELNMAFSGVFGKYGKGHVSIDQNGQWLGVVGDDGVRIIDISEYATTAPDSPTSLTATDNTTADGISVSWTPTLRASKYQIFRNTTNDPGTAIEIASGISEPQFLDSSIDAGQTYYYWVKGKNWVSSSEFSPSDIGERKISPPTNLTASDGAHADKIVLNWNPSISAVSYTVFRSQTNDSGTAVEIANGVSGTSYDDTTADPAVTYFYWVLAVNASGLSELSASASGIKQLASPDGLSIDLTTSASVGLSWDAVTGASNYKIFRGITSNPAAATELGQTTATSFSDTTAVPGQLSYWFLQALHNANESQLSDPPISGRRIFAPPVNRTASAAFRDRIDLSWSTVPSPVISYEIRRSVTDDFPTSAPLAAPTATSHADTTAPSGLPIYYWVRAMSPTTGGEWSASFQGFRRIDNFGEYAADHGLIGADAEPTANPDDDEFTNFEEWAQGGSDPTDASSRPPLIARIQTVASDDYFTISYLRFYGGSENGAAYEHQWATYSTQGTLDLESRLWPNIPLPATRPTDLSPAPNGYEWGCVRLPVSTNVSALGFMQLLVTPPPTP